MNRATQQLSEWRSLLEARLAVIAAGRMSQSGVLSEAVRYVVTGGGKRVRGLLTLAVERDLSGRAPQEPRGLSSAVAIEALHAASLVHDDLPALDNDDVRRGKPSCHKAFSEATAILVGDALVGVAFEGVLSDETLATDLRARVAQVLARVWSDLCVGQQLDISRVAHTTPRDTGTMIRLKTGVLFGSAVACGALCAGVYEAAVDRYFQWGVRVGECFQALDDLDDGDRPEGDRAVIQRDCEVVTQEVEELFAASAGEMTREALRAILKQV